MNQNDLNELITKALQELLKEKPDLLPVAKNCQCHQIDPNKMRILLWKDTKNNRDTYILKIAEQKFVSSERRDKRGVVYWKFRELIDEGEKIVKEQSVNPEQPVQEQSINNSPAKTNVSYDFPPSISNRVDKFRERQAKAQAIQSQTASQEVKENYVNEPTTAT